MRPLVGRRSDPAEPDRRRWARLVGRVRGAAIGVAAFLVGFASYQLLARWSYPAGASDVVRAADPGTFRFGSWLFFAAHNAPVVVYRQATLGFQPHPQPYPVGLPSVLGTELLGALVPVVSLLVAGAAVDRLSRAASPLRAAFAGTRVALGYVFPVTFLVVLSWLPPPSLSTIEEGEVYFFGGPEFPAAILVAGLLYPVAFGGLGAMTSYLARLVSAAGGVAPAFREIAGLGRDSSGVGSPSERSSGDGTHRRFED